MHGAVAELTVPPNKSGLNSKPYAPNSVPAAAFRFTLTTGRVRELRRLGDQADYRIRDPLSSRLPDSDPGTQFGNLLRNLAQLSMTEHFRWNNNATL